MVAIWHLPQCYCLKPKIFWANKYNTLAAAALAPRITRSSAAMMSNMHTASRLMLNASWGIAMQENSPKSLTRERVPNTYTISMRNDIRCKYLVFPKKKFSRARVNPTRDLAHKLLSIYWAVLLLISEEWCQAQKQMYWTSRGAHNMRC